MLELLYTHCLNLYLNKAKTFDNHYRTLIYQVPDFYLHLLLLIYSLFELLSTHYRHSYLPFARAINYSLPKLFFSLSETLNFQVTQLSSTKSRNFGIFVACTFIFTYLKINSLYD